MSFHSQLEHSRKMREARASIEELEGLLGRPFNEYEIRVLNQRTQKVEGPSRINGELAGLHVMSFGSFSGTAVKDLPLDYLEWLTTSTQQLCNILNAYQGIE